ncbi:hypothetical protein KR200_000161 [Drosophila serrata]|nr:hypothetical protein KR200_000161 [Drosophila serrata]
MAPAFLSPTRGLYQRRSRRPLPVVPERRMNVPEKISKPPRILVKSFWAIQRLESDLMRAKPPDQREDLISKWKYLESKNKSGILDKN